MMASIRLDGVAAGGVAGGHLAAFLFGWSVSGEGEIPACAGMTVDGAGMTAGEGEIPACAGMTVVGAGMTAGEGEIPACAGMTVKSVRMTKAAAGYDGV